MAFYFLKASKETDSAPKGKGGAEKENAGEKETASKEEGDSQKEIKSAESNSKVKCRHCDQATLSSYIYEYDAEGDAEISLMDCLNCGCKYFRFEKFEKSKDDNNLNWGGAFFLLVAMLFTIIVIKGERSGLFFNEDRPAVRVQEEEVRDAGEYPVRVLNDAEPFRVGRDN